MVTTRAGNRLLRPAASPSWPRLALVADTPGKPNVRQAWPLILVSSSGKAKVPAAPLSWLTSTQTDRLPAVHTGGGAAAVGAAEAADVAHTADPMPSASTPLSAATVRRTRVIICVPF